MFFLSTWRENSYQDWRASLSNAPQASETWAVRSVTVIQLAQPVFIEPLLYARHSAKIVVYILDLWNTLIPGIYKGETET
jgi:hypothetical protein